MSDLEIQMLEQTQLIEQLKSMIRERDDNVQKKDKELQEVKSSLSKLKLQAKAKLARESKDAKEEKGSKCTNEPAFEEKPTTGGDDGHLDWSFRAKSLLLKKLEEKDQLIREHDEIVILKDQQIEVKEKIIAEREQIIISLTTQLRDKTKLMEDLQAHMTGIGDGDAESHLEQMYAQIVYKDKNLLDLNEKILELERQLIDLQEFVGEKNEVIRGRDKVIQVLQNTIKEKDQNVTDQAILISKLTGKVEMNDEILGKLHKQVHKSEYDLQLERERFHLRLTESQKYFEETLKEQEDNIAKLRSVIQDKEIEVRVSENDLREILARHESDLQKIMSKGEDNIQDSVIQILEQKLKDTNEVLEGKIKVIEVLQRESSQKEHELEESKEVQKIFKEKLQQLSEQMMMSQATFVDMEMQWQEERKKYEANINGLVEKHEHELMEKNLQIQSLKSSASQLEDAYAQAISQYSSLQERYHQLITPSGGEAGYGVEIETSDSIDSNESEKLKFVLKEKEQQLEQLECLKQKNDSLTKLLLEKQAANEKLAKEMEEKIVEFDKVQKAVEDRGSNKGETKMLKIKAQLIAKVKSLEKEVADLKKNDLHQEMNTLKAQWIEVQNERDHMKFKLDSFEDSKSEHGNLKTRILELECKCSGLEMENSQVNSCLTIVSGQRDLLQAEVAQLQQDLKVWQDHNQDNKLQELEEQLEIQKAEVSKMLEKWKVAMDALAQEQALTEHLRSEKIKFEVKAGKEQVEGLEIAKIEYGSDVAQLSSDLSVDMQQPLEFNEVEECVVKEQQLLQHRQFTEQKEITIVTENIDLLDEPLTAANDSSQQQTHDIQHLQNQITEFQCSLKEKSDLLELTNARLHGKDCELESLQVQFHSLEEMFKEIESEKMLLSEKLSLKEVDLNDLIQQIPGSDIGNVSSAVKCIDKLVVDIKELHHQIEEQKSQISDFQNEVTNLNMQLSELNAFKIDLEEKLEKSLKEIDILKECQSVKGEEFENKIQLLMNQISDLDKEYLNLQCEKDKRDQDFEKFESEYQNLIIEKNNFCKILLNFSSERNFAYMENKKKMLELETVENENKNLKTQIESLMELETSLHLTFNKEKTALEDSISELKSALEIEKSNFESRIEDLQGKYDISYQSLNSLLESDMEKENCLQERERKFQSDLNVLQNQLEDQSSNIQTLLNCKNSLSEECSQKEKDIQEFQKEVEILKCHIDSQNNCVQDLNIIVEQKQQECDHWVMDCNNLKCELNDIKDKCNNLENVCLQRSSALDSMKIENEVLHKDITEKDSVVANFKEMCEALKDNITHYEELVDALENSNSDLSGVKGALELQLKQVLEDLQSSQNKVLQLQQEFEQLRENHCCEINTLHKEHKNQIDVLQKEIATVTEEMQSSKRVLNLESDRIIEENASFITKEEHLNTLLEEEKSKVSNLVSSLAGLEEKLGVSEENCLTLQNSLNQGENDLKFYLQQIALLQNQIENLHVSETFEKMVQCDECKLKQTIQDKNSCELSEASISEDDNMKYQLDITLADISGYIASSWSIQSSNKRLNLLFTTAKKEQHHLQMELSHLETGKKEVECVLNEKLSAAVVSLTTYLEQLKETMSNLEKADRELADLKLNLVRKENGDDEKLNDGILAMEDVVQENIRMHLTLSEVKASELGLALKEKDTIIKRLNQTVEELTEKCSKMDILINKLNETVTNKDNTNLNICSDQRADNSCHNMEVTFQSQIDCLTDQIVANEDMPCSLTSMFNVIGGELDFQEYVDKLRNENEALKEQLTMQQSLVRKLEYKNENSTKCLQGQEIPMASEHEINNSQIHPAYSKHSLSHVLKEYSSESTTLNNAHDNGLVHEHIESTVSSDLNASVTLLTSDIERDNFLPELGNKLQQVTEERQKYKTENEKLLKHCRGKEAKLLAMNKNFDKLQKERDELLVERETLENKVQDLINNFTKEFGTTSGIALEKKYEELEIVCEEKDAEIDMLSTLLRDKHVSEGTQEDLKERNVLSKEIDKLKMEAVKFQVIGKGKTAKILKIGQSYEEALQEKDVELEDKMEYNQHIEPQLIAVKENYDELKREKEFMSSEHSKLSKVNKEKESKYKKLEELISCKDNEIQIHLLENNSLNRKIVELNAIIRNLNEKEIELQNCIEYQSENIREWQNKYADVQHKVNDLENIIRAKNTEIESSSASEIALKKLKEEKIILEFKLDCTKEELKKIKGNIDDESKPKDLKVIVSNDVPNITKVIDDSDVAVAGLSVPIEMTEESSEDVPLSELPHDEMKIGLAHLYHKNKRLIQESLKLQKLCKGKDAKLRKIDEFVKEQQKIICDKETDRLILQECVKDLNNKIDVLEEIKQELLDKMDNVIADIGDWRDAYHDLEEQLDAAHEALDRKNEDLFRLDFDLMTSRDDIENLGIERDEMERQRDELLKELQDLKSVTHDKENEMLDLKQQLALAIVEKDSFASEVKKINLVSKGKNAKLKKLEESVSMSETALKESNEQASAIENELWSLQSLVKDIENEKQSLKLQLQSEIANKTELDMSLKSVEVGQEKITDQLQEKEKQIHSLETEVEKLKKTVKGKESKLLHLQEQLKSSNTEKDNIYETQSLEISGLNAKLSEMEASISHLEIKLTDKEESLKQLTQIASEWENKCKEYDKACESYRNALTDKNNKIQFLEEDNKFLKDNINGFVSEIETLNLKNKDLVSSISEQKMQVLLLEVKIEEFEKENIYQKKYLEENHFQISASQEKCQAFEKQFCELMTIIQQKDTEILTIQKRNHRIENEREKLSKKLKDTETELIMLSKNLEQGKMSGDEICGQLKTELADIHKRFNEKDLKIHELNETLEKHILSKTLAIEVYENQLKDLKLKVEDLTNEKETTFQQVQWSNQYFSDQQETMDQKHQLDTTEKGIQLQRFKPAEFEHSQALSEAHVDRHNLAVERETLLHSIDEKDSIIESLTTEKNKMIKQNLDLQNEVKSLHDSLSLKENQSKVQREEMQIHILNLSAEIKSLNLQIRDYNSVFSMYDNMKSDYQEHSNLKLTDVVEKVSAETIKELGSSDNTVKILASAEFLSKLETPNSTAIEVQEQLLDNLKHQVEQLSSEKESLSQQLQWFQHFCTDTQESMVGMEQKLLKSQSDMSDKEVELNTFQLEFSEQSQTLSEIQTERHNFAVERETLLHSIEDKESTIKLLTSKHNEILKQNLKFQCEIHLLTESLALKEKQNKEDKEEMHAEILKLSSEFTNLKLQIKNYESQFSFVNEESKVNTLQHTVAEVATEVSRETVNTLGSEASLKYISSTEDSDVLSFVTQIPGSSPAETDQIIITNTSSVVPSTVISIDGNDKDTEVKKLKKLCKAKDAKITNLEEQLKEFQHSETILFHEHQKIVSQHLDELNLLKIKQEQMEKTLIDTHKYRENYMNEVNELKNNNQRLYLEIIDLRSKNCALEETYRSQILELTSKCQELQSELIQSKQDAIEMQTRIENEEYEFENQQQKFTETEESLRLRLQTQQDEMSQVKSAFTDIQEKYQVVLYQITDVNKIMNIKENEIHEIKHLLKDKLGELEDLKKTNLLLQQFDQGVESEKERFGQLLKAEREEIQALYEQMNQLVSEKLDLECNLEQKECNLRSAAEELRKFASDRDHLDELIENRNFLKMEVDTYSRDLQEIRKVLIEKDEKIQSLENKLSQKEEEAENLNQELSATKRSVTEFIEMISSLQEKIEAIEENAVVSSRELESKIKACSKLKDTCEEKDHLIQSLKQSIGDASVELEQYKRQFLNIYDEITAYKNQLQEHKLAEEDQFMTLKEKDSEIMKLKEEILINSAVYKDNLFAKDNEISMLKNEHDIVNDKCFMLMAQLAEHGQSEPFKVEATADQMNADNNLMTIPQETKVLDYKDESSRSDNSVLVMSMEQLKAENSKFNEELANSRAEIASQQVKIDNLEHKLTQKDTNIASLLENMQEMEERLNQLILLDNSNEGKNKGIQDKVSELESEILKLRKSVEEKDLKFTKALATARKLKVQANETKKSLEIIQAEKETLEKQLLLSTSTISEPDTSADTSQKKQTEQESQTITTDDTENDQKLIQNLQSQCQSYAVFSQHLQEQVQCLMEQQHNSERSNKQLEEQFANLGKQKISLEALIQEQELMLKTISSDTEEMKTNIKNQYTQLEEKTKINGLLKHEIQIISDSEVDLKQENAALQERLSQVEAELQQGKSVIDNLNLQLQSYGQHNHNMEELTQQCISYQETIQKLQMELGSTVLQVQEKNQDEEKFQEMLHSMTNKTCFLETQLSKSNEECTLKIFEIDRLTEEIKVLEKSVSETNEVVRKLKEQELKVTHLTDNIKDLNISVKEKDFFIQSLQNEILTAELTVDELRTELNSKVLAINQMTENLDEFEKEKLTYRDDVLSLQLQMKDLNQHLLDKEHIIKNLNEKVTLSENETDEIKNRFNMTLLQLHENSKEVSVKNAAILELDLKVKDLIDSNKYVETTKGQIQTENENLKAAIAGNLSNEAMLKGLLEDNKVKLQNSEKEITELKDICLQQSNEITQLVGNAQVLQKEMLIRDCKLNDILKECEKLKLANNVDRVVEQQLEDLQKLLKTVTDEKHSLFEDLIAIQDEMESLKLENERMQMEKSESLGREVQINGKLEELTSVLMNVKSQNEELKSNAEQLINENKEVNANFDALQTQMVLTQKHCSKLTEENTNMQEEIIKLQHGRDELLREKEELDTKLRLLYFKLDQYLNSVNAQTEVQHPKIALVPSTELEQTYMEEPAAIEEVLLKTSMPQQHGIACQEVNGAQKLLDNQDFGQPTNNNDGKNKKLTIEIDNLQDKMIELTEINISLRENNKTLYSKLDKMLSKLKLFKERNDVYLEEIVLLKQQFSANVRTEESEIEHLQHKCDLMQNQNTDFEKKLQAEWDLNKRLQDTNQSLQKEKTQLEESLLQIQSELNSITAEYGEYKKTFESAKLAYNDQINISQAENAQTHNKNVELLEEIDSLTSSLNKANREIKDLVVEKEGIEEQITNLVSQIFVEKTRSNEQSNDVLELKTKIKDLEISLENAKDLEAKAQRQLFDMKEQYQMLEKDNENFQGIVDKAKLAHKTLKDDNVRQKLMNEKLESETREIKSIQKKLHSVEKELAESETEKGYLEDELDGLREDLKVAKQEKVNIKSEFDLLLSNLKITNVDKEALQSEINSLNSKLNELKGLEDELIMVKMNNEHLERHNKDHENELLKFRQTIDNLNEELLNQNDTIAILESKLKEFTVLDSKLQLSVGEIQMKDNIVDDLKQQIELQQGAAIDRISVLENSFKSLKSELQDCKAENISLKKQSDKTNKQLQKLDTVKQEYENLSLEYNKIISDNSEYAKQIEELNSKLKQFSMLSSTPNSVEKAHFDNEKLTLSNRIHELEKESSELWQQCAELKDNKSKLEHTLQEVHFELDTLKTQHKLIDADDKLSTVHSDYSQLQLQFNVVMQQKKKLQTDLNLAQKSLAQREARCQQLAVQVSQLVEDRSYLNIQLASLSKSLREKEHELPIVQQQYRTLYQSYTVLQAKVSELEKQAVVDFIQRSPAPSGTITPVDSQQSGSRELKKRLEATVNEQQRLQRTNTELIEKTRQLEQVLEITLGDRLGGDELRELQRAENGDAMGKVFGVELTRDASSYLGRLQRWLSLQSAMPPSLIDDDIELSSSMKTQNDSMD